MEVTDEQRFWARVAGVLTLAHLIEIAGDYPTIIARGGETFVQTSQFVVENAQLWRTALLALGIAWILVVVVAFAFYVVLEPVNRRLAQLALLFRLGGAAVGAASVMFRVSKMGIQMSTTSETFSIEQLTRLSAVLQHGANYGIYVAWMLMGLGYTLFFLLFPALGLRAPRPCQLWDIRVAAPGRGSHGELRLPAGRRHVQGAAAADAGLGGGHGGVAAHQGSARGLGRRRSRVSLSRCCRRRRHHPRRLVLDRRPGTGLRTRAHRFQESPVCTECPRDPWYVRH